VHAGSGTAGGPLSEDLGRLQRLSETPSDVFRRIRYGANADQFGQLWRGRSGSLPVVVLIHGGYWRARYPLDVMHALAADLCSRGYAVWNLEYRRIGMSGGGWPGTFEDVAQGIDFLADLAGEHCLDLARLVVIGHSAGGQLALWSAARSRLPAIWGVPRLTPAHVISLAGVCDLAAAAQRRLSDAVVFELLGGGPQDIPEIYAQACPRMLLPLRVRQTLVHGTQDADVPLALSEEYARAAQKVGDQCAFLPQPGADHFDMIDPTSSAWASIVQLLNIALPRPT